MIPATLFSQNLSNRFAAESAKANFSEVAQFGALINAFRGVGSNFHVEEYHGSKHQVIFNGKGAWGRSPARCELCDVVFIAYRAKPNFEVRVTFLQAKRSVEHHINVCSSFSRNIDQVDFKANLEQWDLLARRPTILPHPPFEAPPTLLSDAKLPSIGSFGVFHRRGSGVEFFYASADILSVAGHSTTKHGRLQTNSTSKTIRRMAGYHETVYCCCLPLFAHELYSMRIGSPLEYANNGMSQSSLARWLADTMIQYRKITPDSVSAEEILNGLQSQEVKFESEKSEENILIPSLVLIRSEAAPSDL